MLLNLYNKAVATVTYNKKSRSFTVIWKDYAKEALGERYPYGRKSQKWQGDKHPSASERRTVEKELLTLAANEEYQSKGKADYIRIHGKDDEITASGYLSTLKDDELSITTRGRAKTQARLVIKDFVAWLDKNHKGIALHKINEAIARQYYKHLQSQGRVFGTIKNDIIRLSYLFKQVIRKYEDSPLKYKNPFATLRLDEVITKTIPHKRKPYTQVELESFLHFSKESTRLNEWQRLQRYAIYYFLMVTGWRINDILLMKWQQLDLQKGIIKMTHSKTQNKGITTELYITDLMNEILTALYLMRDKAPSDNKDFVFSYWNEGTQRETNWQACIREHFIKVRKELKLDEYEQRGKVKTHTYTIHSFRGTVITRLTQAGYQEARVNYLVGHAPRTTEAKHYLTLTADDTKELVEYMEDYCKAYDFSLELPIINEVRKNDKLLLQRRLYLRVTCEDGKCKIERNPDKLLPTNH